MGRLFWGTLSHFFTRLKEPLPSATPPRNSLTLHWACSASPTPSLCWELCASSTEHQTSFQKSSNSFGLSFMEQSSTETNTQWFRSWTSCVVNRDFCQFSSSHAILLPKTRFSQSHLPRKSDGSSGQRQDLEGTKTNQRKKIKEKATELFSLFDIHYSF